MLILTRRIGESLLVGDDVKITILEIQGNQIRLGIKAPREIEVHREEIYQRIKQEQKRNRNNNKGDGDDHNFGNK